MAEFIFDGLKSKSFLMEECFRLVLLASTCDIPVLIVGETGTGKELIARAIHQNSPRKDNEYCIVDCTAIPETLVESLLFGHKKGTFTGAIESRHGMIKQAHKGTLFLDELGELSHHAQKILVRVIQGKTFKPLGENEEVHSDFRIITATNRSLNFIKQPKNFRQDLFFRLQGIVIEVPPLRDRPEDIIPLAKYFVGLQIPKGQRAIPLKWMQPHRQESRPWTWQSPNRVKVFFQKRPIRVDRFPLPP